MSTILIVATGLHDHTGEYLGMKYADCFERDVVITKARRLEAHGISFGP